MKPIIVAGWIDMKTRLFSLFIVFMFCSGHVFADCSTSNSFLDLTQLNTILAGNFACGQSTKLDPPGWNELHVGTTGGALVEQHEGGTTIENVGTWTTSNVGGRGRDRYSYSGGISPEYEVAVLGTGICAAGFCTTLPQTYNFCGVGGGAPATLQIRVTIASISPPISNCPSNP
jgi:hypothetical protein